MIIELQIMWIIIGFVGLEIFLWFCINDYFKDFKWAYQQIKKIINKKH